MRPNIRVEIQNNLAEAMEVDENEEGELSDNEDREMAEKPIDETDKIHATNFTSVPSVHHVVDAVELLKEAFAVYTDPLDRAKLYAELFQEKHNETEWSVIAGYAAVYIKSQWYIETTVTEGKSKDLKKDKDKDKDKDTLYLIFSTA